MELITKLWKNFKVQPEIWFFYGFFSTFTLSIRKVIWFFPLRGEFNEYSGIYLYLSDIFLMLTLVAWMITILYNKTDILSILKNVLSQKQKNYSTPVEMFHARPVAKNCSTWNNSFATRVEQFLNLRHGSLIYLLLPLALVIWSFISLIWAENKIVSIFRSVKILEFYLLYVFIIVRIFCWNYKNNVPSQKECSKWNILRDKHETLLKKIFSIIMFIGLFQAIIGIIQFVLQHSVGLFWLKESLISPNIAGVAKVIFNGETFIRAYGLFPHPNILGGFLLFSIFVSLLYYKLFHSYRNALRLPRVLEMFHVEHFQNLPGGTIIVKLILGIQLLALILTFSKSAILSLILGLVSFAYVSSRKECSTWNIQWDKRETMADFFRKKKKLLVVTGLIIIFSVFILKPDWNSLFVKSLDERSVYVNASPARIATQNIAGGRGTIEDLKTLVFGIGNSQFVLSMENMSVIKENWMLEPVHNVFLLVWSELGIVGLFILILFMLYIIKMSHPSRNVPLQKQENCSTWNNFLLRGKRGTMESVKNTCGTIFIGLLFIMFFDHYLWDIQQGSLLLWITLGFLVGAGECEDTI